MSGQDPKATDAKVIKDESLNPSDAKWIRLKKITYTDPLGKTRDWESAERTTRASSAQVDGVGVVAILQKPTGPELLLQKQFRPPVNQVMIEVPSGLIDEGESPVQSAVRELKEETGYVGVPAEGAEESVVMFNDPGFTNTNTLMIPLTIDLTDPSNLTPKPELEENEFIETFSLPLSTLWDDLKRMNREEGYGIDARVGTLAEGFELGRRFAGGKL